MTQKTAAKIKPVGNRIVAERIEEEVVQGGIILPDSAKKKSETVKVIAVGTGKTLENGKEEPIPVKVGDIIMIDKYAGQEITIDDEEYVIVRSDDIIAIIE